MHPHRTKIIILKVVSWIFRVFGLACVIFGFYLAGQIVTARPQRIYFDTLPEFYFVLLMAAIFIPGIAGLFSFVVSGLIDLRVTILTYAN